MESMRLTCNDFGDNQPIPVEYTCDGKNLVPPLAISEVPGNTVSLALVMEDPDSPAGHFTHWILYNIPPSTSQIDSSSRPPGSSEGINTFRHIGYGGPCPQKGEHHYVFSLYALDSHLDIEQPDRNTFEDAVDGHILETTHLTGVYERK